jgi:hypothetical protein
MANRASINALAETLLEMQPQQLMNLTHQTPRLSHGTPRGQTRENETRLPDAHWLPMDRNPVPETGLTWAGGFSCARNAGLPCSEVLASLTVGPGFADCGKSSLSPIPVPRATTGTSNGYMVGLFCHASRPTRRREWVPLRRPRIDAVPPVSAWPSEPRISALAAPGLRSGWFRPVLQCRRSVNNLR